jgi:hypothetical protein
MCDGSAASSFDINSHNLESRTDLETYLPGSLTLINFSATWTPKGSTFAFTSVTYDKESGGRCSITNHLHLPSLAVLAIADDVFSRLSRDGPEESFGRIVPPPTAAAQPALTVVTPQEKPAASVPLTRHGFVRRMWDEAPKTLMTIIGGVIVAAVLAYLGLKK